jgi:katanin p60 ATPase-containing subunit A1
MFDIYLKDTKMGKVNIDELVRKTDGYSGHDIMNICKEAALMPLRKKLEEHGGIKNITDFTKFTEEVNRSLEMEDFIMALKNVNKSVGTTDIKRHEKFMEEFGSA